MIEELKELRNRNRLAKTNKEKKAIQEETDLLRDKDPEAFAEAMYECMKDTREQGDRFVMKKKLTEISKIISISYIAKEYFKKTPQWFYQRMNENIVNGKKAQFTPDEIEKIKQALKEISYKIAPDQ